MPAPIQSLRDDFEDNATATAWVAATSGSATVAETGGQARFTLPSATAGSHVARYSSRSTYDLTGGSFSINIGTMVATGVAATAFVQLYFGGGANVLRWNQLSGTLAAQTIVGGVSTDRYTAAWNASTYKYLRIRESGGNILWESSTNGTSWTTRATVAVGSLFAVTALYVDFGAFCGNVASPGSFRLDDVNLILPALSTTWNWTNKAWSQRHRFRNITLAATGGQAYVAIADDVNPDGSLQNPRYYSGPADAGRILTLQATQAAAQAMAVNLPSDSRFELPVSDEGRIVRLYHRSISGATYILREDYGRRIVEADDIVGETFRGLLFEGHQFVCEALSALTANMGELTAGIITGAVIRTAVSGARVELNSGAAGGLIGYASGDTYDPIAGSGTYQIFWSKADGKLYAGGGDVWLDDDGVTIEGPTFTYNLNNLSPVVVPRTNTIEWTETTADQAARITGSSDGQLLALGDRITLAIPIPSSDDNYGLDLRANGAHSLQCETFSVRPANTLTGAALTVTTDFLDEANSFVEVAGDLTVDEGLNVGTASGAQAGQIRGSGYLMASGANALPSFGVIAMGYDTATPRGLLVAIESGTYKRLDVEAIDLRLKYQTTNRIQINATGIGLFGVAPVARPNITGVSSGTPTAAQQAAVIRAILTAGANLGAWTDSTT